MNLQTLSHIMNGSIIPWFLNTGIQAVLIIIGSFVVIKLSNYFIEKGVRKIIISDEYISHESELKRENTLIRIMTSTAAVLIVIITFLMLLQLIGVEIAPLIAAMGIAGVALGFGGQYLIRDIISGLFIILENQYRVGDVVCFDNTCGLVEDITLRMTSLRDLHGTLHHVPHGEIKRVSNKSKHFARVNFTVGVSYSTNLQDAIKIINDIGIKISEESEWKDKIISPPKFLRIDQLADSSIQLKILGDTKPSQQWAVEGELKMRIKEAFDKNGIEIPFPQIVLHQNTD